jgi:hypothetical protein
MQKQKRSYTAISLICGLVILAGVSVFILTMFASTSEEPEAVFGGDGVTFLGQYGQTYLYSEINEVSLEDSVPAIGYKKNGAGLGEIKKGDWEVDGMGTCRLFIMSDTGPYVVINTKSGNVIVNYNDSEKTKALYEDLLIKR